MKQFSFLTKLFLVFAVFALVTSCEPEVIVNNPTTDLVDEAGFLSADATVDAGTTFMVKLSADKGDGEMQSLTIQKDGSNLATTDFTIDGVTDNNPKLLFLADRTGFTYEIAITAPADAGISTYTFKVDSDDNGTSSKSIDITVEENTTAPALTNDMNASIEIPNPSTVKIVLTALKGSSPLSTITVQEEGVDIADLTRLTWRLDQFTSNPNDLVGDDKEGFTAAELFLKSQSTVGTTNYTIVLTDEAGLESTIDYAITLLPIETPLSTETTGVSMFNNSGAMFGAIDLETFTNVSSTNADGDIVDLGLDTDGNWRMQIAPVTASGTEIRSLVNGETYDGITSVEALQAAYDAGTSLAETGALTVGSTYTASRNGVIYLLTVTAIDDVATNNDSYTFSFKKA